METAPAAQVFLVEFTSGGRQCYETATGDAGTVAADVAAAAVEQIAELLVGDTLYVHWEMTPELVCIDDRVWDYIIETEAAQFESDAAFAQTRKASTRGLTARLREHVEPIEKALNEVAGLGQVGPAKKVQRFVVLSKHPPVVSARS